MPVINPYLRISSQIFVEIRICLDGMLTGPVLVVLKNMKKFNFQKSRLKSRLNKQWSQVWTQ